MRPRYSPTEAGLKGFAIIRFDQSEANPQKFAGWFLRGQFLGLHKSISVKAGSYSSKQ